MLTDDLAWLFLPGIFTAVLIVAAVIALFYLARLLKSERDRLAGRTLEPLVTVSLEPSAGDRDHLDLVVENCGFAPAFDVKVVTTPEIPSAEGHENRLGGWHDVSLLRPNKAMIGYACRAAQIAEREVLVEVSWKRHPNARERSVVEYPLDMRRYRYQAPFAMPSAHDELLTEIRNFRRDWRPIARGEKPLRIDVPPELLRITAENGRGGNHREDRREDRVEERVEQPRKGRRSEGGKEMEGKSIVSSSGPSTTRPPSAP